MKKFILILFLFCSFTAIGQTNRFPSIDSLKTYILKYVRNSTVESFTNLRLQNVVYGTAELLDSLTENIGGGVDSIWRNFGNGSDTLKYSKNGTNYTIGVLRNGAYVPYTGATADVDLGNNSLNAKALNVTGTAGKGHLHLRHQSSLPNATGQSTAIYADNDGNIGYKNDGFSRVTLNTRFNTADRVYRFQNKSYTIADSVDVAQVQSNLDSTRTGIRADLNGKQGALTLTTTGSSGAATLTGNTLNIPQYSGGGGGGTTIGDSTLQWATNNGNTATRNVIIGAHNTVYGDTAEVAPYRQYVTGAANYGSVQNRWALNFDASLRVRQKGYVQYLKIYTDSVPVRLTSFYVTIWRRSTTSTAFNIVDSLNILPYLRNGQNFIRLPRKMYAQDGDYVGWGYSSSASGNNFLHLPTFTGSEIGHYFNSNATHPVDGTSFVGLSTSSQYLPIVLYGESPAIVFIGDSKISGFNDAVSAYTQTATTARGKAIPDLVSDSLGGLTYQNLGIGNTTVKNTIDRFDRDVVRLRPKYAVIEIGVNSIAVSISTDSIMNDYRRILSKCTTANIKPVIIKILPWTNGTNARNRQRDTINNLLTTEATNYNAILVDANADVGQFRSGGDVGNLWDIQAAYSADGVHFTDLGYRVISSKVYQTLRTQVDNLFPAVVSDGGSVLQLNSRDKGLAIPIWTAYQKRINDSLHFRFREGVIAYDDSTGAAFINKRAGFREIATYDIPRSGTNATRLAAINIPIGTRFYQTDYLVGDWVYTGSSWTYQVSDFVLNREFERASFNSFQAPTEAVFVNSGQSNTNNAAITNMEMPVIIATNTNANGGVVVANHAGANNTLTLSNRIAVGKINLPSSGALSDATNRYVVRFGMGNDVTTISEVSNFAGVRYCDSLNSGAFVAYSRSGGVETVVNTSVTVALGTTYEIVITHKGTAIEYWINGVQVANITTNIPAVGRGVYYSNFKTAGTTSRSLVISGAKILKF